MANLLKRLLPGGGQITPPAAAQGVPSTVSTVPVEKAVVPAPMKTVGVGGTVSIGGYLQDNEVDSTLKGWEKWKTFSRILVNVAIVGAGVRYFLNLVAKAGWIVKPADESAEAIRIAKLVERALHDMETPLVRVVRRAAMYKFYGYTLQEWTAKKMDDGTIGFKDVEPRPHPSIMRWEIKDGKVIGVWQQNPSTFREVFIPRAKLVYMIDDSLSDSPEGLGLFRHLVPYANRLLRYEQLEGFAFETDLRGIPVARAPLALLQDLVKQGQLTKEDKDKMENVMREFIQNHVRGPETGLLLDSATYQTQDEKGTPSQVYLWMVELLKGETSSLPDIAKSIERLNRALAWLLGVEHLLFGMDGKGSFALSKDKTNQFSLVVESALGEIASTLRNDLLRDVMFPLNGWDTKYLPTLEPEPVNYKDIEQIASVLRDLATAGAPLVGTGDPANNQVRGLAGIVPVPKELIAEAEEDASLLRDPKPDPKKPDPEDEEEEQE